MRPRIGVRHEKGEDKGAENWDAAFHRDESRIGSRIRIVNPCYHLWVGFLGRRSIIGAVFFLGVSQAAWASKVEDSYLLSTGAGVSDPSVLNGLRDNPAGLALNEKAKLQMLGLASSSTFNPITMGLHAILGNGTVGGQFGAELGIPGAFAPAVRGGFAVNIKAIKTAIGVGCQVTFGGAIGLSCPGIGLLINPEGPFHVGLELGLYGLLGGFGSFPVSAGAAFEIAKIFTLALDAGTSIGGGTGGISLMPAAGFQIAIVQVTAGYGFSVLSGTQGTGAFVPGGFTAGLGLSLGKIHIMGHYNHSSWMMLSLAYRF